LVACAQGNVENKSPQPLQFDVQPWLDDFHQLIKSIQTLYPDLEWTIRDRHMDLPQLRISTEKKLSRATSDEEARKGIKEFLASFGDGHLSVQWSKEDPVASQDSPASRPICSRLGYETKVRRGIDFTQLTDFTPILGPAADSFPGGILSLPGGPKVGVLRIAEFNEHRFPGSCEAALPELHLHPQDDCDAHCAATLAIHSSDILTAWLMERAAQLRSMGAAALLVDVTHNDGGDSWNEPVARSLAPVPLIDERFGFIKSAAWITQLQGELRAVESDLKKHRAPGPLLKQARARLRAALAEGHQPCDRSHVFDSGKLDCSSIVTDIFYWSGILPYLKPGSLPPSDSRSVLFGPSGYIYSEGTQHLPLYVVVDRHSWSSAERFAGLLQDNHAAIILGERTGGAGCGFTGGNTPVTLTHSHASVRIPDCIGLRFDGSNANNGVTPDVGVPWASDDKNLVRAQKLQSSLIELTQKPQDESPNEPRER